MSHFNQPKIERKNCVWTTKYQRLLEVSNVQHVEMKSVLTFQPTKRLVSTTVKSAKPAATNIAAFKDQKPQVMFFAGDGTHTLCLVKKTTRDCENEKASRFSKKFLRQSQSTTPQAEPKKAKIIYDIIVPTSYWLIQ